MQKMPMPKVALELFNQVSCVNRAVEAVSSLFLINFAERKKKLLYRQGPGFSARFGGVVETI